MEKLKMHSPDLTQENIARIQSIFPNCVTEIRDKNGNLKLAVDFDQLRQELSDSIVEGPQERYHLNWPGKREALLTANAPIAKTLRPCREESVNFDTTKNIFIEGDNLEALKLLQESYLGKVKMIYIDPPYNTGNDFIYEDDFAENTEDFLRRSNQKDEEGNRLVTNTETNGRFHSDWLTMIYPRLKLAKNLLKDDGVIFISIDYHESHNLRKICEEVFGESNFLAEIIWYLSSGPQAGHFTRSNEAIVAIAKNKSKLPFFKDLSGGTIVHGALKKISKINPASEVYFPKGSIKFEGDDAVFGKEQGNSEKQFVTSGKLSFSNGVLAEDVTIKAGWAMKNQLESWLKGFETFDSKGQRVIRFFFNSKGILFYEKERGTVHPKTVISSSEVGSTKDGGDEIQKIFGRKVMSFPKPSSLIQYLCKMVTNTDDIILDFFAGSSTTAHATMQLNAVDGGNRRFIMVQIPENSDVNSEAYKSGYKNIAEISKERIRRVGEMILNSYFDESWNKDVGFRVFKIDSSNMKEVYYRPDNMTQAQLEFFTDNIKHDRTEEDLLFQVLQDWGVYENLSLSIRKEIIQGKTVFLVDENALVASFDKNLTEEFVKKLTEYKPLRVVFRDSGFTSDAVKINVEQIFKQKSPETDVRTI
ncbi:site-specific DNA-methyltransferase [Chlamydiales bacterium]|nr:site-specific DNA-methyltransferase [Chlamydiales bacterium]